MGEWHTATATWDMRVFDKQRWWERLLARPRTYRTETMTMSITSDDPGLRLEVESGVVKIVSSRDEPVLLKDAAIVKPARPLSDLDTLDDWLAEEGERAAFTDTIGGENVLIETGPVQPISAGSRLAKDPT